MKVRMAKRGTITSGYTGKFRASHTFMPIPDAELTPISRVPDQKHQVPSANRNSPPSNTTRYIPPDLIRISRQVDPMISQQPPQDAIALFQDANKHMGSVSGTRMRKMATVSHKQASGPVSSLTRRICFSWHILA
jgi:hypothetical protein